MSHEKIMIVEENMYTAADLADTLVGNGYDVVGIVSSGEYALSMAKHVHLDLILMDIMINQPMNGVSTAAQILSRTDLPIIYMTHYADEELISRAKDILPYGFLTKPIDENMMLATIRKALTWHTWNMISREGKRQYRTMYHKKFPPLGRNKGSSRIKRTNPGSFPQMAEWMAY